jgi:Flp pilus assembly pilin Flp
LLLVLLSIFFLDSLMPMYPCKRTPRHGQALLEYALIIFLIAVVAIVGIVFLVPVILQGLSGALPAL